MTLHLFQTPAKLPFQKQPLLSDFKILKFLKFDFENEGQIHGDDLIEIQPFSI